MDWLTHSPTDLRTAHKMTIRPAMPGDVPLLASLIRDAFRAAAEQIGLDPADHPRHPSNSTPERVQEHLDEGAVFYILEHGGIPCGCVGLEEREPGIGWIKRLSVLPGHRRRGHGTALVHHALAQARAAGARRVDLALFDTGDALRAWYERLGFRFRETRDSTHLPFTVTFMSMDLA